MPEVIDHFLTEFYWLICVCFKVFYVEKTFVHLYITSLKDTH